MIPLPHIVLERITAALGIDLAALKFLGGGREDSDGIAYAYPGETGERVLKILPFPAEAGGGLDRLAERLKFAHFLGQNGVDIVYPLPLAGGELVSTFPAGDNLFAAYIMPKISGAHPKPNDWSPVFYQRWGQTLARLHRVTRQYPTWQHAFDPQGKAILGWQEELDGFVAMCLDDEVKTAWAAMRRRLEALPQNRDCFGFIHNDPHIENILDDGQHLTLIDFDVANYQWFACDIAIACQALLFSTAGGMERPLSDPAALAAFLRELRAGYEQEYRLEPFWWEQIDVFIQYRRLLLYTVLQGWLSTVPETRASWKDMILREPRLC